MWYYETLLPGVTLTLTDSFFQLPPDESLKVLDIIGYIKNGGIGNVAIEALGSGCEGYVSRIGQLAIKVFTDRVFSIASLIARYEDMSLLRNALAKTPISNIAEVVPAYAIIGDNSGKTNAFVIMPAIEGGINIFDLEDYLEGSRIGGKAETIRDQFPFLNLSDIETIREQFSQLFRVMGGIYSAIGPRWFTELYYGNVLVTNELNRPPEEQFQLHVIDLK